MEGVEVVIDYTMLSWRDARVNNGVGTPPPFFWSIRIIRLAVFCGKVFKNNDLRLKYSIIKT
jgi:hypothetical protein